LKTRMQGFALLAGAALALALTAPAGAQDIKIGFVNVPFLLQNAPQTQAVDQRLRNEFAPREAELQSRIEDWNEKVDRYERDAPVMGQAEADALRREIEQGERDLQRQQQTLQEDANIRQEELVGELQAVIARQIQTFAQAEGYDLILANVVFASDAIDITEEVLAAISDAAGTGD